MTHFPWVPRNVEHRMRGSYSHAESLHHRGGQHSDSAVMTVICCVHTRMDLVPCQAQQSQSLNPMDSISVANNPVVLLAKGTYESLANRFFPW